MAQWHFWDTSDSFGVYEDIYIRTNRADWFEIVNFIAGELKNCKEIIDVGCGDGHTTKQILDRIKGDYVCDLLEPNKTALAKGETLLSLENNIRNSYNKTLSSFESNKKYDSIYTIHTNYYWASDKKSFDEQLDKLINITGDNGRVMILTLPEESDHYNIMIRQVYPKFNYSGYIVDYYKKKGYNVRVKRFRMRMSVVDILSTDKFFELKLFYKFIHNTDASPNDSEIKKFLEKIEKFQKNGNLDFRDDLIIVEKK